MERMSSITARDLPLPGRLRTSSALEGGRVFQIQNWPGTDVDFVKATGRPILNFERPTPIRGPREINKTLERGEPSGVSPRIPGFWFCRYLFDFQSKFVQRIRGLTPLGSPGMAAGASPSQFPTVWLFAFVIATGLTTTGCGRARPIAVPPPPPQSMPVKTVSTSSSLLPHIDLPQPSQRLGTAVVILIDTSGSMDQSVRDHAGHQRTKDKIAREALQKIIGFTDTWQSKHRETPLFSGHRLAFRATHPKC